MKELKRSDSQYREVEEFADYELTQCVAYEMAARDWHYRDMADGVVNLYNTHKEVINYYLSYKDTFSVEVNSIIQYSHDYKAAVNHYSKDINSNEVNEDKLKEGMEWYFELISLIDEIELIKMEDIPHGYEDPRLGEDFWKIKNLIDNHNGVYERYTCQNTTFLEDDLTDEIVVVKNIIREGYTLQISLATNKDDCLVPIEEEEDHGQHGEYVSNIEEYKQFIEDEYFSRYQSRSTITIDENFKRPKIEIDELKTINPEITLNLNKPLHELIAYITHIKNDIENNDLLKLPIELLGIELKRADNLVCNDKGEKCFDPRSILSKQQKMADMFYIYDCLKLGYTQRKIQNEVYNYYADKGMDNITLDSATLRKYKDIAMDYIVDGKYKEMLTGISTEEAEYRFG